MSFKPKTKNHNNNHNNNNNEIANAASERNEREREFNEREREPNGVQANSAASMAREPQANSSEQSERQREQSERERESSSIAAKANNPFINSEVFIYKVGSIISIYHEFLSFVNGNQFLSDCYYYYNIVNNSPNKRDCIQAKAAHKSIMNHYRVGYGSLSPLLREEFELLAGAANEANAANAASKRSAARERERSEREHPIIIKDIGDHNDNYLFLPPEFLTSLKSKFNDKSKNHKKLSYVLDFIEGIQYLKKTTQILSIIDIRKFI